MADLSTEPILKTENAEEERTNDRRNGNIPTGDDVVSDAEVMILESLKKKNEERKKTLKTIYMSYDKLSTEDNYLQIDDDVKLYDSSEVTG